MPAVFKKDSELYHGLPGRARLLTPIQAATMLKRTETPRPEQLKNGATWDDVRALAMKHPPYLADWELLEVINDATGARWYPESANWSDIWWQVQDQPLKLRRAVAIRTREPINLLTVQLAELAGMIGSPL